MILFNMINNIGMVVLKTLTPVGLTQTLQAANPLEEMGVLEMPSMYSTAEFTADWNLKHIKESNASPLQKNRL